MGAGVVTGGGAVAVRRVVNGLSGSFGPSKDS